MSVGHVTDLEGNRIEYHIPPITAAHQRNLAKDLSEMLAERQGLSKEQERATFGHIMRQLEAKAAEAYPRMVGWHRGARLRGVPACR